MTEYTCNTCRSNNTDFRVPVDLVGAAIMAQHLLDTHKIEIRSDKLQLLYLQQRENRY